MLRWFMIISLFLNSTAGTGQGFVKKKLDNLQFSAGIQQTANLGLMKIAPEYRWHNGPFFAIGPEEIQTGSPRLPETHLSLELNTGIVYKRNALFRIGLKYCKWSMNSDPLTLRHFDQIDPDRGFIKHTSFAVSQMVYTRSTIQIPLGIELRNSPVTRWNVFMNGWIIPEISLAEELTAIYAGQSPRFFQTDQIHQGPRQLRVWFGQSLSGGWRYDPYGTLFIRASGLVSPIKQEYIKTALTPEYPPKYRLLFIPELSLGIQVRLLGGVYEDDPFLKQNMP